MRVLPLLGAVMVGTPAMAAELSVTLEVPRLAVAEYHRPYVAIWVEQPDRRAAATLAVWYDLDMRNNEGEKWLKDLRQWWRRAGRELRMPVDGISGATRAPGRHTQGFDAAKSPLSELPPGTYTLVVEAAREVGGREAVRLPFQWPPAGPQSASAQGSTELGAVTLELKP